MSGQKVEPVADTSAADLRKKRIRATIHDIRRRIKVIYRKIAVGDASNIVPQRFDVRVIRAKNFDELQHLANVSPSIVDLEPLAEENPGFSADPFLYQHEGRWYLFYEVWAGRSHKGVIAYSHSDDAVNWEFGGICLTEPFHLSYPQVFEWNGQIYMMPETAQADAVLLYRATKFPSQWTVETIALTSTVIDPSLILHEGKWYMQGVLYEKGKPQTNKLMLYVADKPTGPWTVHPSSPIQEHNNLTTRPGGRISRAHGKMFRVTQNGVPCYGTSVAAYEITKMTPTEYEEVPMHPWPLLQGSGTGWNHHGMHHIDVHEDEDGTLVCAVDGWHWTPAFVGAATGD